MNFSLDIGVDTVLAIGAGILGFLLVFNVATALVGAALGVPIQRIQFGFSPTLRLFRIGSTEVRVGPILLSGHVKYVAPADGGPYAPWPMRALLSLVGPLTVLAACLLPLGARLGDEALIAWPQMWAVVTDWSSPVNLNEALRPSIERSGLTVATAVVAVKGAMFNLLPLPVLSGGVFITTLIEGMTRRGAYLRLSQPILLVSLAMLLGFVFLLVFRVVTGA